jgi:putative tryptophan/tyrosine transport system substrate-binding protein
MRRREFISFIGGVAALWPLAVRAQQQAIPVIGYVTARAKWAAPFLERVREGLAEHGYFEGQNYRFEIRETNLQTGVDQALFRELVEQKVTLLIINSTDRVKIAGALTQSIPIVFTIASDPVQNGFVASLNKPGGNITGIFNLGVMLAGKRLEVLHELVPSATKFTFLTNPNNETLGKLQAQAMESASNKIGLDVLHVSVRAPDEFDSAFEAAVRGGAGGMIIGSDAFFVGVNATTLVATAARYRVPTIYADDSAVIAGGLICYGTNLQVSDRLVGRYAGRILKGEKPADMPVELSTRTVMMVNLKTAKALGITVPMPLLGRADEVIE